MTTELLNIQEAYTKMYASNIIISEEVHKDIQSIMDDSNVPVSSKLSKVTSKVKSLIAGGHDTGLESDKPKNGSSRAVFFPKEHKEISVDGKKTKTPTAVKIAFHGTLDKHHGEDTSLGQDQNEKESDHYINSNYGILREDSHRKGEYHSSDHESGGVLAPVFSTHPDHHYLEMGKVDKPDSKSISEATKTKEFPKGLKHDEIQDAMMHEHAQAHGQKHYSKYSEDHLDHVKEHPWVDHAISMMHASSMHPGDLRKANMGIYTHPVTGKKHLAIIDYGYSNEIAKKYSNARRKMGGR
jgi:hypothetical protein